jgi:guanylate kinase
MDKEIIIIIGVSGCGKNTLIREMTTINQNLVFIPQLTTRRLRDRESVRIYVSEIEMDEIQSNNNYIVIQASNGFRYAISKDDINNVICNQKTPIIDWPLSRLYLLKRQYSERIYCVYLLPPSIDILKKRLNKDGRDCDGIRLASGIDELYLIQMGYYDMDINKKIVSEENRISEVAKKLISIDLAQIV